MTSNPWDKWFWSDWENDPGLKLCSLSAQGLWMRMLCVAAKATPKGFMKVGKEICDDAAIAVLVGRSLDEITPLLAELERREVFSRTAAGAIYNRRMVRAEKKAKTAQKNGKLGGNPKLCNTKENPPSDNLQDNQEDNAPSGRSQKPEARSQIQEGGGGSAHAREADTDGGTVPQPTEADARAIVRVFLNLRDELWPNNPNFPAPTMTLESQALGFLQLGGPVELITATLERGMRTAASQGKTATVSLKAFHLSINDAIAGHRAGIKIPEQSHVAGHSRRQQKPTFDEQQQRNREGIYAAFADELDPSGTGP